MRNITNDLLTEVLRDVVSSRKKCVKKSFAGEETNINENNCWFKDKHIIEKLFRSVFITVNMSSKT